MLFTGSLPNSKWQIEPELMRIIMQNLQIDDLISNQSDNRKLTKALELLESRVISRSLASNDEFDFTELY